MGAVRVRELQMTAFLLFFLSAGISYLAAQAQLCTACSVTTGIMIFLMVAAGCGCLDMIRYDPADSHSILGLVLQYCFILFIKTVGRFCYWRCLKRLDDCRKTQHNTLMDILNANGKTVYGKEYRLSEIKTREEFIKRHPLTTYAHFEKYVERIANGENNILTKSKTMFLAMSSGTTGKNKLFPVSKRFKLDIASAGLTVFFMLEGFLSLGRNFGLRLFSPPRKAPCGLPMGSLTAHMSPPGRFDLVPRVQGKLYTEKAAYYAQSIFLLGERECVGIEGFSSNLLHSFFKFIEANRESLCHDIEQGCISEHGDMDTEVRRELSKAMKPDPARGDEIRKHFARGVKGLAKRLWPKMKFVMTARAGGFQHCAKLLQESYLYGLDIGWTTHGATEGFCGMKMDTEFTDKDILTMVPGVSFLEFIPLDEIDKDNPSTLFMEQLEIGQSYEIVCTSKEGFYRNRFGDIIKVVGFNRGTPMYEFQYRTGHILNLAFERTPEQRVYDAVQLAKADWPGVHVVEYVVTENTLIEAIQDKRTATSCYVMFLELEDERKGDIYLTDAQKAKLDEHLCVVHGPYKAYRVKGTISPIHILQVARGTFDELKKLMWVGYQNAQFKQPRVLRAEKLLRFLLKQTISKPEL